MNPDGTSEQFSAKMDKELAMQALRGVLDPELGADIVSLGLVYGLDILPEAVRLRMTLTSPGCPLGGVIVTLAQKALEPLADGRPVEVELVWIPQWTPEKIEPETREKLRRR